MSIIVNTDAETDPKLIENIKAKLNLTNQINTNAPVIKPVSPTVLLTTDNKLLPKFKINNENELNSINLENLKNKENIEAIDKIDENIIKMEEEINKKEKIEEIEILENDEEDNDQRRLRLDKENILKGFQMAFDPFGNCITVEDEDDYNLVYKSYEDRLNEIFN